MIDDNEGRDLLLDSDGDLDMSTNDLALIAGIDACAQEIKTRLGDFKGEWFLDLDSGFPYFQEVLGKKYNQGIMEQIYRAQISPVDGVDSIEELLCSWNGNTRTMTVSWRVLYGEEIITDSKAIEV